MGQHHYLWPLRGVTRHTEMESRARTGLYTASAKSKLVGTGIHENDRPRERAAARSCLFSYSNCGDFRPPRRIRLPVTDRGKFAGGRTRQSAVDTRHCARAPNQTTLEIKSCRSLYDTPAKTDRHENGIYLHFNCIRKLRPVPPSRPSSDAWLW